jgi:DNA adenine methylase
MPNLPSTSWTCGEPFLKWPGGKRALVKEILPHFKCLTGKYYEPFLGGGAVFFALGHKPAFLSDSNEELINCYIQVRDNGEHLIGALSQLTNSCDDYYSIRERVETDLLRRAARFIYLTTLSFNGIYRLNLKGVFNVPYGHRTKKRHYDAGQIRKASEALKNVKILSGDFEKNVEGAKKGDAVYFDPPYTVAHENNGFLKYNDKIFSWSDQVRLHKKAADLARRGCRVVVSNANHSSLLELYKDFKVKIITRSSVIAASSTFRKPITEAIFYNKI